ncbi:hypothetical protein OAO01_08275 [Oligoflexia bacterium]|nr:hypothetical protein [Oligoflexia bacterium]
MARSQNGRVVKKMNLEFIHRLKASVSLLAFAVILASGVMAKASMISILTRATVAIIVVAIVTRIIVQVLVTYEEMDGGKG